MNRYRITPQAADDLAEIRDFYNKSNPGYAAELAQALSARFKLLAVHNEFGRARREFDEFVKGLRSSLVKDHVIFYRVVRGDAQIIRVAHQTREMRSLISGTPGAVVRSTPARARATAKMPAHEGHRCCDSLMWSLGTVAIAGHHPGYPATDTFRRELQAAQEEVARLRELLKQAGVEA